MKVFVEVPDFWDELLEEAKKMEGWGKRTDYIRELIKKDLKAKGLLGNPEELGFAKRELVSAEGVQE